MERALLVTVDFGRDWSWSAEERATELRALAMSAGANVIASEIVRRHEPVPSHFIGTGKAEELMLLCARERIKIVIFNNDLAPTQGRNLEEALKVRVIDRTQLILDIFARRAHSNEGKLQVELAQLAYALPRLSGKGVSMSRLGGGIGTRGPGEQKLEVDRRRIRDRISKLSKDLEGLRGRRSMMRKRRERFNIPAFAIVGYTNSGKSTLLNSMTASNVIVQNKLFSTLDPTSRQFIMPDRQKVLFIDTVGFLSDLPHSLIEAFKATLEEVVQADMLVHVIDASHPKAKEQAIAVYEVLKEIGAADKKVVTVFNKIDKVDTELARKLRTDLPGSVCISALKRQGLEALVAAIARNL